MRHLKSSLILVTTLFLSMSLFAQTDSVKCNSQIQFHLINGYSLSYLNSISDQSAFRFKLDLGFSINDGSRDENIGPDLSSRILGSTNLIERKNNSQLITVVAQYLNFPYKISGFRLFWGVGPFVSFNRNFYQATTEFQPPQGSSQIKTNQFSENENYNFGIGINSVIGIECFVTNKISLIGEYGLSISYEWIKESYSNVYSENKSISSYSRDTSGTNWGISLSNIKLGFAYHF